jgi:hypothetical protein
MSFARKSFARKVLIAGFALASFAAIFVVTAEAASYGPAVRKYCRMDYRKFCGEYGLDSPALRLCMDKAGRKLSRKCVNALVKEGLVSHSEVKRRGGKRR